MIAHSVVGDRRAGGRRPETSSTPAPTRPAPPCGPSRRPVAKRWRELRRLLGAVRPGTRLGPPRRRSRASTGSTSLPSRCGPPASPSSSPARACRSPLPAGVDLSAYRIVQEALTNTLRHARATRRRGDVPLRAGLLEIDVVDDGRGRRPSGRRGRLRAHRDARAGRAARRHRSRPGPLPMAATACTPRLPLGTRCRDHPGRHRRRPDAGAGRVPHDPRRPRRHRGRRRGRGRRARRSRWSMPRRPTSC